jgi:hypothetical protein
VKLNFEGSTDLLNPADHNFYALSARRASPVDPSTTRDCTALLRRPHPRQPAAQLALRLTDVLPGRSMTSKGFAGSSTRESIYPAV